MTHEELLASIDDQEFAYDTLANALRAVVELHKPRQFELMSGDWCSGCTLDDDSERYPCRTIQVIEKELQ
jgi:hypothetical protein